MFVKKLRNKNFYTYGTNIKSNFHIKNINQKKELTEFDLIINLPNKKRQKINKLKIPLLGIHNVRNAVAATAVAIAGANSAACASA